MLIILCVLPIGATEVRFTLVCSGPGSRLAIIDYLWPEIENLFAEEIKQGEFADCHPKIIALKEDLKFTREYLSEAPKGSIELALPIPVQTASNTIKRYGKKKRKRRKPDYDCRVDGIPDQLYGRPETLQNRVKATGL
jgi:hypothetical protein